MSSPTARAFQLLNGGICLTARDLCRYGAMFVRDGGRRRTARPTARPEFIAVTRKGGISMPAPREHLRYSNQTNTDGTWLRPWRVWRAVHGGQSGDRPCGRLLLLGAAGRHLGYDAAGLLPADHCHAGRNLRRNSDAPAPLLEHFMHASGNDREECTQCSTSSGLGSEPQRPCLGIAHDRKGRAATDKTAPRAPHRAKLGPVAASGQRSQPAPRPDGSFPSSAPSASKHLMPVAEQQRHNPPPPGGRMTRAA